MRRKPRLFESDKLIAKRISTARQMLVEVEREAKKPFEKRDCAKARKKGGRAVSMIDNTCNAAFDKPRVRRLCFTANRRIVRVANTVKKFCGHL